MDGHVNGNGRSRRTLGIGEGRWIGPDAVPLPASCINPVVALIRVSPGFARRVLFESIEHARSRGAFRILGSFAENPELRTLPDQLIRLA